MHRLHYKLPKNVRKNYNIPIDKRTYVLCAEFVLHQQENLKGLCTTAEREGLREGLMVRLC